MNQHRRVLKSLSPESMIGSGGLMLLLLLFSAAIAARQQPDDENEIRWQDAAAEVDSFPFSSRFIDSVREYHKVTVPQQPLRILPHTSFCMPETLVYKVGWGPFNAGYVVFTTRMSPDNRTISIEGKALSNNFVGAFYRLRDYVISTFDAQGIYPLFFEKHLREGKRYKADEYTLFDQINRKVYIQTKRNFKTVDSIPLFVHDYLSALYLIRTVNTLTPGKNFTIKIFVHKKVYDIFFAVEKIKDKETDVGTFSSILLKPRLEGEGRAFNKGDQLDIWLSNDDRRIPVVIRSKIKFGSIFAKLIWTNHTDCHQPPLPGELK